MNLAALILGSLLTISLISCRHSHKDHPTGDHSHKHNGHANHHMNETPFKDLVERFESDERNEYQKPDEVIEFLGNLKGKTVMDLGAGTGYFSFRLAEAGASVIAADVDDRFLSYVKEKKSKLGLPDSLLTLREVPYDSPDLSPGELDMLLIVNTYHHIENRPEYFSKVKTGLKSDGKLVIIDFQKMETPVGPPLEMKIHEETVMEEISKSGFTKFEVNKDLLPYQYIIIAE